MEDKNKSQDLTKSELFYGSYTNIHIDNESLDDINKKSFQNIDFILIKEDEYHYLCPNCFKFPFIEFCKTKKYVKLTCSCYFSKIISIIDLFDESKNYITRNNLGSSGLLSSTIIMNNYENNYEGLKCKEHNRCFKYFCKTCLLNLCDECIYEQNSVCHKLVDLESLKINYAKLNTLINIINSNNINDLSLSENIQNIKVYLIDENNVEKVTQNEENQFNKYIRIIINDYKNYPNISHFYNIQNILYFFNLNNNNGYNYNTNFNKKMELNEKEEISMEYFNNNSNIYLFSENFVDNNRDKVYLEIEKQKIYLKSQHSFKSKENIITVKLIIKENITEIDMSEMFINCNNLISVNGISNLKKTKIINQYKMFYNCSSLISIPDIDKWDISTDIDRYLIFYNCISLIYFPNSIIKKIYSKKIFDLDIFITQYYQNGKDILLRKKIENNKENINFYGNELIVKEDNIVILNGNNHNLLFYCLKNNIKINDNILIVYNQNEEKKMKINNIKIKILNKFHLNKYLFLSTDISDISKWNTNNITDMSYMFYKCESLSSLPDISKWNTKNVTNMSYMFCNCTSLNGLPDLSKWNTNNVTNMSYMFCNCTSLNSLPDISKWNTNIVIDMSYMFCNCTSLYSLPDLSKWNTTNVTNMIYMFCNCTSLYSLPDLSKWNINNVINMSYMLCNCESLSSFPDLSKWNINNITENIFFNCQPLANIGYGPKISKPRLRV